MRRSILVLLALVIPSLACDNSEPAPTAATPTVPLTSQTFTGTVDPGGRSSFNFVSAQNGEIDITLTAAGPPPTITMGLALGAPNATDGSCALFSNAFVQTAASATPQLAGTATAGSYCVTVYDVGNQAAQISYTVTVAHL